MRHECQGAIIVLCRSAVALFVGKLYVSSRTLLTHRNFLKALDPGTGKERVTTHVRQDPDEGIQSPAPEIKAMWTVAYRKYFGIVDEPG